MKNTNEIFKILLDIESRIAEFEKNGEYYNRDFIIMFLQIIRQTLVYNKEGIDIVALEVSEAIPIQTNSDLNDTNINIAFLERPKILSKKMN
jgi:hypothetical protein